MTWYVALAISVAAGLVANLAIWALRRRVTRLEYALSGLSCFSTGIDSIGGSSRFCVGDLGSFA